MEQGWSCTVLWGGREPRQHLPLGFFLSTACGAGNCSGTALSQSPFHPSMILWPSCPLLPEGQFPIWVGPEERQRVFCSPSLPRAATLSLSPRAEVLGCGLLPLSASCRVSGAQEQQDNAPHSSSAVPNPSLGSQLRENSRFCCEESETLSQVSPGALLFQLFLVLINTNVLNKFAG